MALSRESQKILLEMADRYTAKLAAPQEQRTQQEQAAQQEQRARENATGSSNDH